MFTNEVDHKKFDRDTSFGHMFKRFLSVCIGVAVITGAYTLLFKNDLPAKAREMSKTPVVDAAGVANSGIIEQGGDLIGDIITQALMASQNAAANAPTLPNAANVQSAVITGPPAVMTQLDRFDHSFFDLTHQYVKNAQGEIIGQINDVLADPATGNMQYIVYTKKRPGQGDTPPIYYVFDAGDIMMQEGDGDIQLKERSKLRSINSFVYNDDVYTRFISLKTLRQGYVSDSFDKTVGEIHALIYRNGRLEDVFIILDESFAIGENRLFHIPFEEADIISSQNGYTLRMSAAQTKDIAKYLYE